MGFTIYNRLVQFTDLHFGESEVKDLFTQSVQTTVLASEIPDFVVMTGDSVILFFAFLFFCR